MFTWIKARVVARSMGIKDIGKIKTHLRPNYNDPNDIFGVRDILCHRFCGYPLRVGKKGDWLFYYCWKCGEIIGPPSEEKRKKTGLRMVSSN